MGDIVEIYGAKIRLPDKPADKDILYSGEERKNQKWVRPSLPDFFETVEYDNEGTSILTRQQEDYAAEEVNRCFNGVWARIGGKDRYINGRYYFYLRYYTLEDGAAPEFREADRLYFLFFHYWFCILWCLGLIRIKKRRQGASSQSCSNLLYEAIFYKNSNCGLLSKTKDDSKDTFTQMVSSAYKQLPVYLKPRQVNKEDSVTELVFAHKSKPVKGGVAKGQKSEEGHNSRINYRAPVLNAYDRGRMSYVLGDEFGKFPLDVPASKLLAIISKTLVKGVKRVGWIDMPSTVNEMTKGGGAEYKKIWDQANQFKKTPTVNRIVRFFQPAYESYEGFIDEFGDSVVGEPTHEQYQYLVDKWVKYDENGTQISELNEEDIKLGAKEYVLVKRRADLTGEDLEEETRMNPCTEEEAFMYAGVGCEFNAANINRQIKELEENPPFLRQMRFVPEKREVKSIFPDKKPYTDVIAKAMDDAKGGWFVLELPNKANHFSSRQGTFYEPLNHMLYQIGVDTVKDSDAINGSKPRILVMKKSCIVNGVETGMYPVAMWLSDARLDVHFDEQVLLACKLFGCKANYEIDARGDYYRYFSKENCGSFLNWTPKMLQNPVKRGGFKPEPGTRSGDPFQLSMQLQIAKAAIDGTDSEVYNGHVHKIKFISLLKQLLKYDHSNRTPYDEVIAFMMALSAMFGEQQNVVFPQGTRKLLPVHRITMPA